MIASHCSVCSEEIAKDAPQRCFEHPDADVVVVETTTVVVPPAAVAPEGTMGALEAEERRRGDLHLALCDLIEKHTLADVLWMLAVINEDMDNGHADSPAIASVGEALREAADAAGAPTEPAPAPIVGVSARGEIMKDRSRLCIFIRTTTLSVGSSEALQEAEAVLGERAVCLAWEWSRAREEQLERAGFRMVRADKASFGKVARHGS